MYNYKQDSGLCVKEVYIRAQVYISTSKHTYKLRTMEDRSVGERVSFEMEKEVGIAYNRCYGFWNILLYLGYR